MLLALLLFLTALGSFFWYRQTGNDTYGVLAVASALACVIWGFVVAHWSIHLLSLLLLYKFRSPILSFAQVEK